MIINNNPSPRRVKDFEFTFASGFFVGYSIDEEVGDRIEIRPNEIKIHMAAKPSYTDPNVFMSSEDIILDRSNAGGVVMIKHRERDFTPLSPEQQEVWKRTLQEFTTKTVQ